MVTLLWPYCYGGHIVMYPITFCSPCTSFDSNCLHFLRMALLERMPTMNAVILEGDSSLTGSDTAEPTSLAKGVASVAQVCC